MPAQGRVGVPTSLCRRCGFPGPHETAAECISMLRDRIATLEFKASACRARFGNRSKPVRSQRLSPRVAGEPTRAPAAMPPDGELEPASNYVHRWGIPRSEGDDPERAAHVERVLAAGA